MVQTNKGYIDVTFKSNINAVNGSILNNDLLTDHGLVHLEINLLRINNAMEIKRDIKWKKFENEIAMQLVAKL